MQVYKKMDVGTAKVTKEEMQDIHHELIDVQNYDEPYNVKVFQEKCRTAIDDVVKRGKFPILCGGTGLYLKAALYDYEFQEEQEDTAYTTYLNSKTNEELVVMLEEKDAKAFGNDPIEIVRDWVSVAEDGYVTLRIRTLWGGITKHVINLVSGVNKDNVYEFDLRHNAQGDTNGRMGDALIAFDLNSLWKKHPKELKIKLNWLSFSGKKSAELSLKMHTVTSVYNAETPSFLHRIE